MTRSTTEFSMTWNGNFSSYSWYTTGALADNNKSIDKTTLQFLGVLTLLMVTFGAPANIVSLLYFLKKSGRNAGTVIYRHMNIVDLLICILLIPVGLNYFNPHRNERPYFFNEPVLCNVWSIAWHVATRLSIYLIGVMSTARAISLIRPLYHLQKCMIIVPLVVYTLFLSLQQTLPYWWGSTHVQFYYVSGMCTWTFVDITEMYSTAHKLCDFFFIQMEFLLPVIPIVVSTVVTMIKLRNTNTELVSQTTAKNRKHATVTIIILTTLFVALNIPYLIYQFLNSLQTFSNGTISLHYDTSWPLGIRKLWMHLCHILLIGLNSCINPIIYFARIKELRSYVFSPREWRRKKGKCKGRQIVRKPATYRKIMLLNAVQENSLVIDTEGPTIENSSSNGGRSGSSCYLQLTNGCSTNGFDKLSGNDGTTSPTMLSTTC